MYKFKKKNQDDRAKFANEVCKLIVVNSNFSIDLALLKTQSIYDHFEEHVDNIYELIEDEIPLFSLYRLLKYGADNWDFTPEEYQKNIEKCKKACEYFYFE